MKITKFAQSCVMIQTKGEKILVDPGVIGVTDEIIEKWKNPDAILITHKHSDHCDIDSIQKIRGSNTKIYTSAQVVKTFPDLRAEIVQPGYKIAIGEVNIEVTKAVHGYTPFLQGGNEIEGNLGFIVERGKRVYLVGDSIGFKNEYKCNIIFVPVCNHGLVMGPFEAALFAKETNAELVIPYHVDNPKYPAEMDKVKDEFEKAGLNYKILQIGEEIEF